MEVIGWILVIACFIISFIGLVYPIIRDCTIFSWRIFALWCIFLIRRAELVVLGD